MVCHGNKYYTGYTPNNMEDAIKDISSGEYTISESAILYRVPRKTFSDKMNNKHTNPNGRPTLLTPDQDKYLINYIHYMAEHAFLLTVQQI